MEVTMKRWQFVEYFIAAFVVGVIVGRLWN
jgi:Na+/citrate or Na+/malate symporter